MWGIRVPRATVCVTINLRFKIEMEVSSVARNRNWCRDQDREDCTSELPVADLQHHPKTTPTEEEATVRRLYVRPPVEHLRIT
ncbi:unnamed protein product [Callosobruchus maculatus]|uniref:Uncharacterized protein n=1 Tax=Callosobruchus maculatus TaxID=64391 RepID=A0A653C392_CALMS|nr:unnamed protein product [Callosobruchus maculatus]